MTDHEPERDPEVDRTFGEGQDHEPPGEEGEPRRRFSEGQEELPARSHKVDDPSDYDPERNPDAEGRFSEGQETLGETEEKEREGRFSDGQAEGDDG